MRPQELLRLASRLAAETSGPPQYLARNRSLSTAYYAVFHAVAECCGRELVGAWRPWPAFRHVYRSLDHGHARTVFKKIKADSAASDGAKIVADVFIDLQQQRHLADYDPGFAIGSRELSAALGRAERAIGLLEALPGTERQLIAARLIGRTRE